MIKSFLFLLLFYSWKINAQTIDRIDKLYVGQSIDEAKKAYPEETFRKIDGFAYCVDGESQAYIIEFRDTARFFIYSLYDQNVIVNISILSHHFSVMDNLTVGMTFEEIFTKHPNLILSIDDLCNFEYAYFPDQRIAFIFNTTDENRIGIYSGSDGSYEFSEYSDDLSKKVDRIRL